MFEYKVYKVTLTCWKWFFAFCQIILVGVMAVSLSILNWVKTDFDTSFIYLTSEDKEEAYFQASSFIGKFIYCEEGCGVSHADSGYGLMKVGICEYYDDYKEYSYSNFYTDEHSDSIESICKMFKNLLKAGQFKMLVDVITFVFIVLWFISMLCIKRKACYCLTFLFSFCSFASFFAGSIIWFVFSTATFNDCSKKPKNGELPNICATTGPILMVLKMIIFALLVLCYLFVAYGAKTPANRRTISNQHINNPQNYEQVPYNNYMPSPPQLNLYPQGIISQHQVSPQIPQNIVLASNINQYGVITIEIPNIPYNVPRS